MRTFLLKLVSISLGLIGLSILLGNTVYVILSNSVPSWTIYLYCFGTILLTLAIWNFILVTKRQRKLVYQKQETKIIKLAKIRGGSLSATDVTLHTSFTHQESKDFLNKLYLDGLFDMDVNEEATVVYRLKEH